MPAVNPRITITITPELHAVLRRLSELSGQSQSGIVGELLGESVPVFERMVTVLEAAQKLKAEAEGATPPAAQHRGVRLPPLFGTSAAGRAASRALRKTSARGAGRRS